MAHVVRQFAINTSSPSASYQLSITPGVNTVKDHWVGHLICWVKEVGGQEKEKERVFLDEEDRDIMKDKEKGEGQLEGYWRTYELGPSRSSDWTFPPIPLSSRAVASATLPRQRFDSQRWLAQTRYSGEVKASSSISVINQFSSSDLTSMAHVVRQIAINTSSPSASYQLSITPVLRIIGLVT